MRILRDRKVTRLAQGLAVRRSQTVLKGKCSNSQFSAVHFYFKKVITGTWTGADCPKSHTHACTTEPPGTPRKRALPPFTSSLCKWHHALTPKSLPFSCPQPQSWILKLLWYLHSGKLGQPAAGWQSWLNLPHGEKLPIPVLICSVVDTSFLQGWWTEMPDA